MKKPFFPRRSIVSLALVGSLLAPLAATAPAPAATLCQDPPPIVDVADLTPGTVGTAWTVVRGTEPVSFSVEILGTLEDGIAPGIDFVLIQVSGSVIDKTGGIAAGMSGSPVYVYGRLAGAISYGFFGADHTIGGMTPAAAMLRVLDYPEPVSTAAPVRIGDRLQRAFALASTETTLADAPTTSEPLAVPLSVSGLSGLGLRRVTKWFGREDVPFVITRGASAPAPSGGTPLGTPPEPGDAIGAVYSFGDATFGGIGTATIVCDDEVVAFGHFLDHAGATSLALTNAEILATITDPSELFGPFKLGKITDATGTIFQDRYAGIAGVTGELTNLTPIVSDFESRTLGTSRAGRTDSAYQRFLPFIAYVHVYENLHVLTDGHQPGSGRIDFRVEGLDEDGDPWVVRQKDLWVVDYDFNDVGFLAVYEPLSRLVDQKFEDITVTDVSVEGFATEEDLSASVARVLSSTSLQPKLKLRDVVRVQRGGTIDLQVMLRRAEDNTLVPVDMTVKVPWGADENARMTVAGTGTKRRYGDQPKARSFDQLVRILNNRQDQSLVRARIFGRGFPERNVLERTGLVVYGGRELLIRIVG